MTHLPTHASYAPFRGWGKEEERARGPAPTAYAVGYILTPLRG
jgi:hypothetical protein